MSLLTERTDQSSIEEIVVLPEARIAQRRRWMRRGWIVLLVSATVILASIYIGGVGNRRPIFCRSSALTQSSATPLPVGTMLNASSVVAIQMFTATRGVAIASFWNKSFTRLGTRI